MPGAQIPNVLAARYASGPMADIWSPEHKVVLERQLWIAVLRAQRDLGVDIPDAGHRGLRGRRRQGRPRQHRRPRADHPPRREGPHRGVLRARRPRAHPRRHDLAGPHRERRAAAGPGRPRARPRPHGHGARPAGRAGRRARQPRDHRPQPQRGRPGHHARQAVRQRRRGAAAGAAPGRGAAGPLPAARASRARSAPSRTCSTSSAATRPGRRASRRRSPRHLGFDATLTNVGQVYPRSLDLDVVSALVQAGVRPGQPRHHDPPHGRPRAGHRGLPPGPGRLVGHAPQDEQPVVRAHQRPARGAPRPPVDGGRAGRRPVERGRRLLLGRPPGGAARRLPRRRRALPDLPRRARRLRRLPGGDRARARALPALPHHHEGAHGRRAAGRRPRGGPRGHQGARRGRGAGDAGAGQRRQRPARPPRRRRPAAASTAAPSTRWSASRCRSWAPRWPRSAPSPTQVAEVVARHPDAAAYESEDIL